MEINNLGLSPKQNLVSGWRFATRMRAAGAAGHAGPTESSAHPAHPQRARFGRTTRGAERTAAASRLRRAKSRL